ncbi:MAG: hypothetical protein JSS78_08060 [Bacteroidetes bacterium]|nr:hypothetical protein [Bacteroidota bacterium]
MNHYDWLLTRLDAFIRKYYTNQLIRGTLILFICVLAYVLLASVSEYFLYLPVWLRLTLLSIFVFLGSVALLVWIIIPLSKMAKLGKVISHEQAAEIVGKYFPNISDKLLNVLQLKKQSEEGISRALIEASIDQKSKQIAVIPFAKAVDFSENKKFLPYLLPLVAISVLIFVFSPSIFIDASERLLQPTKAFEKPVPFQFVIQSKPLQAVRNSDYLLKVQMVGNAIPEDVYVQVLGENLATLSKGKGTFEYTFKNVTEPITFKFYAAGFYSQQYVLNVVQKPILKDFKMQIDYPAYTGKKDEVRNSMGDMTVPAGTIIRWGIVAEHTDQMFFRFGNEKPLPLKYNNGLFMYETRFLRDTNYAIILQNIQSGIRDEYKYNVQVVPDQYPVLQVQEFRDTITGKQILLNGTAGDDYGIINVSFHYSIVDDKNQILSNKAIPLHIAPGAVVPFQHYFDVEALRLKPGQKLNYFIEAWDNDAVNGSKASRSEVMTYAMFSSTQLDSAMNANAQQINSGLSNSAQQTKKMQGELRDMQTKMLQSNQLDWEQQQSLQNLAERQKQMMQQLENTKKRFEEQIQQSQQKPYSDEVKEKQEDLKKQMDNLMNNELKEQMKKLQELMSKLNKDNAFQTMKQLEQQNKLFNMDLERMKDLMKSLEMQMRMEDLANKMEGLAKKQLDLKKQTDNDKADNQELSKEQQELKKELDQALGKEMQEMKQLNNQLQQKQEMGDMQENGGAAQQNMQQSQQQLQQGQSSKASQSQGKAAKNLQQMAASLRAAAGGMDMQQIEMDIRAVRQILTNLIRLSFDQEALMNKVRNTPTTSQIYLLNQQEQNRLHNNAEMIRDSLFSLSKRLSKLAASVNQETTELESSMQYAKEYLEARRISDALTRQQYVMTRTNNLALMLNEMLSNLMSMQSQAQKDGEKAGTCQKPGGKKPGQSVGQQLGDIISKQKQLGNAMQQMQNAQNRQQGQQGNQGDKQSNSNQEQNGENGDAEQLARMAAQQAALRRQIQNLQSRLNSQGLGGAKELREVQQKMDKTETDLVNRRLTNELLLRQKEILTRLLETEKAIREQEQDDKRSSKNPQDIARPVPPELEKLMKDRQTQMEFYKTAPAQLKPYYREMVDQYYKMIGNGNQ